jgi:selenocysteine lyase/cysteine desulfurase
MFGTPFDIEKTIPADSAARFEWGTWGVMSVIGARAALEWALKDDMRNRYHHVLKITGRLIEGLKKKGRQILSPQQTDRRSGIVVFEDPGPASTYNKLKSENIVVASRVKSIRASPHYYNSEDEIDRLLMAL